MTTQLPFFGREAELQLLHDAWRAATDPATRTPQIVTFVAETGVGKSRIIQEFYRQLTVSETWDKGNFWPDDFQSHATQLRVNPEFPTDYAPDGPPRFLWLGMRWYNAEERNVVNSQALPTIKEQLIAFYYHINYAMRSRWQSELYELTDLQSTLDVIRKHLPFVNRIGHVFNSGHDTTHPPRLLSEQLMEMFHAWFQSANAIPIILWLDDAMWMDAEAIAFFTQLMHTARTKRWPLLLIATSWPMEWNQFSTDFFLKHDTAHVTHISNATDAELQALLLTAFPQLPHDHVVLLVEKAGGNFLTMIENIVKLRNIPKYFVQSDPTQALSPVGLKQIHEWKDNRQQRIAQRFHVEFDEDIKDFLARMSQTGVGAICLPRVLLRCRSIYPDEALVFALLHRCHTSLAVIMPLSPQLYEFRDRGYFAVAQQHFVDWLADDDTNILQTALVAELTDQVKSAFDADGNLCDPQTHPASLRAAPIKEQRTIVDLALRLFPPHTPIHAQTGVIINEINDNDHR